LIDKGEIQLFLDKYVRVGVPHDIIPNKLFFYFGYLKYVNSTEVKIQTNNGFRIIPLDQIMDIQEIRRQQF
jgi:hypothetical protein